MNRLLLLIGTLCIVMGCTTLPSDEALFTRFDYCGRDAMFDREIDPAGEYLNPILAGFYPDPSICRKGEDYFLVCSSFSYYPGVPIFHSRDLVHWTSLGHVLNRPSQLQLEEGLRLSGGIYAPAISYNPHNDTFYMITTAVDGIGNFLVKTEDPFAQAWSDPIPLPKVGGIDPSLFFDEDDKGYIVHNDAPAGVAKWDGHRAIWLHYFDPATDTTFGEKQVILDAGIDPATKPIWIEGPHLYHINGRYYLMAAEGGTSINHSEVILSAERPEGPYTPAPRNPILTQRNLEEQRADKITCVGHADLIDTPEGDWWAVFLGCRPYEGEHYNTGRETFLLPVEWREGYPVILEEGLQVPLTVKKRGLKPTEEAFTGNLRYSTDFSEGLSHHFLMLRTPQEAWYRTTREGLYLRPTHRTIDHLSNPSMLAHRQQHLAFSAETELRFAPTEGAIAGLVCYQRETHYILLGKTLREGTPQLVLMRTEGGHKEELTAITLSKKEAAKPLLLRVEADGATYRFTASIEGHELLSAVEVDGRHLSTHSAGGFTGAVVGMYTALGN